MSKLSYISPKAAVKESPIHGRGLFAVAPIAAGEIKYAGYFSWYLSEKIRKSA